MRLPFPERFSLFPIFLFCMVLCLFQQLQGTTALFSAGTAAFIFLAAIAFNIAGGFARPSGGFIFSYAVVGVIFGISYKALVGEPAQSNLLRPDRTIEAYVASIFAMLGAAYLTKRFRARKSYLPAFASDAEMYRACIGCLITGIGAVVVGMFGTSEDTSSTVRTILTQAVGFLPLAILIGVTYEIRKSNGERSVNAPVLIAIILMFTEGVLSYSKQGMLSPFVCWFLPAAAQRYRVSIVQVAGLGLAFAFTIYYLVPYSQYGRNFRDPSASLSESIQTNIILLSNLELVRKTYTQSMQNTAADEYTFHYYNSPQGFADRVQMVTPDDAIIDATENGAVFGIFPTLFSFENLIPHLIWPSKPNISFGNTYAHELGLLANDEDVSTGISFSPAGDAFHQARWAGVLVVLPVLCLILFLATDSLCGDTRLSPFPLLLVVQFLHAAPEGGLEQFAPQAWYGTIILFITAFVAARVMPPIASALLGPVKNSSTTQFAFAPSRLMAVEAAENVTE